MSNNTAKPASFKPAKPQTDAASPKATGNAAESKPNSSAKPNSLLGSSLTPMTAEMRRAMIAEAAYYIAERRGFGAGHDLEDWLLAENQIAAALSA